MSTNIRWLPVGILCVVLVSLQAGAPAALEKPNGPKAVGVEEFGPENLALADSLASQGDFYVQQGEYSQAEPLAKRALAIRENVLGPEHATTANTLRLLADIYGNQHKNPRSCGGQASKMILLKNPHSRKSWGIKSH